MLAAGVGGAADASESVAERRRGLRARDAVCPARGRGNGGRRGATRVLAADALCGGRLFVLRGRVRIRYIESERAGALRRAPAPGHGARGGDVVPAACGVRVPGEVTYDRVARRPSSKQSNVCFSIISSVLHAASLACVQCDLRVPCARALAWLSRAASERVPPSKIKPCETLTVPLTT